METRKFGEARPRKLDNPKFKEEEENLRKRFTEQVKVEEQRFRQWEQKLISERDRLNKDLEATHAAYVDSSLVPLIAFTDETQYQSTGAGDRRSAGLQHSQPWSSLELWIGKPPESVKKGVGESCMLSKCLSSLSTPHMSCRSYI